MTPFKKKLSIKGRALDAVKGNEFRQERIETQGGGSVKKVNCGLASVRKGEMVENAGGHQSSFPANRDQIDSVGQRKKEGNEGRREINRCPNA